MARHKTCNLCDKGIDRLNYKDTRSLQRFLTDQGKILSRRITGACARHQRQIGMAVKRARYLALIPYMSEHEL